jgi:hypothetical protein
MSQMDRRIRYKAFESEERNDEPQYVAGRRIEQTMLNASPDKRM